MLAVPLVTPVTTPVPEPIVKALPVVVQFPPVTPSVSVIADPAHTAVGPLIAAGVALTVTTFTAAQPGSEPVETV